MTSSITIKNGEGKWLQFTITRNGAVIDLSAASFEFCVYNDSGILIEKTDEDFDKVNANVGVVKVNIAASETEAAVLPSGRYSSGLTVVITEDIDVDKSEIIPFLVEKSF